MEHAQIWRALDALAARRGLTPSGLARAAGLDPTTFNKSKRTGADGKLRWPSTESVARALEATGASAEEFAGLISGRTARATRLIPIVSLDDARRGVLFNARGFPVDAPAAFHFETADATPLYALTITDAALSPLYRPGDVLVIAPGAELRRGDRVLVRTRDGDVTAHELDAPHAGDLSWIARIVWASQ